MVELELSEEADEDLRGIARYTDRAHGRKQAEKYRNQLEAHFVSLVSKNALEQAVFEHREDYRVSRCQHHLVFFVRNDDGSPLVLAILHENMNLLSRFRERLENMGLNS